MKGSRPLYWHVHFTALAEETVVMKRMFLLAAMTLMAAAAMSAEPIEKPIRYTWIATSCETWNCAVSALVMADGDKHVITLPTGNEERPWLILKRVEEGSIYIPDDEPFACDVFETLNLATSHMSAMDTCRAPMVLSVPDGRTIVASVADCANSTTKTKRRAAR
jgi:hypothetical protein